MDVLPMPLKIRAVANTMIRESSLPDFFMFAEFLPERVRISALDKLDSSLQRDIVGGRKQ